MSKETQIKKVEEINEAWENGNIEADGFDLKIIKGKEKK